MEPAPPGPRRAPPATSQYPCGRHSCGMRRRECSLARLASKATAELNRVPIGDPALLEHRCKRCLVELRIVA